MRNGITVEQLTQSYKDGYDEGFNAASPEITKAYYAATVLALKKLHGFGASRCRAVLEQISWEIINSITSEEAIDRVYQDVGLILRFDDPLDPVQYREDEKNG